MKNKKTPKQIDVMKKIVDAYFRGYALKIDRRLMRAVRKSKA